MVLLFAGRDNNTAHPPGQYLFLGVEKLQGKFSDHSVTRANPILFGGTLYEPVRQEKIKALRICFHDVAP